MSGPRILVIDDSPTVLRVVEGILTKAGYHVWCLENGRQVVETARGFGPELVLVDFAMPEFNGFDVCRTLGEHPGLDSVPIILMGTRGDPVVDRFVRAMGIVDHITKPFAPAALLAVVEHTLAKNRAGARRPTGNFAAAPVTQLAHLLARASGGSVSAEQVNAHLLRALDSGDLVRALHEATRGLAGQPALTGDLTFVPIAEVLQMLSLQRQSGFLVARRDEATISIAFKDGKVRLVTGENIPSELLLGNIVVQERLMEPKELEVLLDNRRGTRRLLGAQLVKLGYMSREALQRALRRQSAELVYELLRWGRGSFEFERTDVLPPEVLEFEFGLGIDELLMEGFRRVDEWGLIEDALPSFELVPVRTAGSAERAQGLTPEERHVLDAVDGQRTVQQIIELAGGGTFTAARLLYRLVSARLIRVQTDLTPAREASPELQRRVM